MLFSLNLIGQADQVINSSKTKIGFSTGMGNTVLGPLDMHVEYFYKVNFFQLQWYYNYKQKRNWAIDILLQPQFNVSSYRPLDEKPEIENGFEFGLNGGFLYRRNYFQDKLSLYGIISAGPHYISGAPYRQSNGFIFSDNFNVGVNIKLYKKLYLDIRPGFRHISNANIKPRNAGINSFTTNIGFFVIY